MIKPVNETTVIKPVEAPLYSVSALHDSRNDALQARQSKIDETQNDLDNVANISASYLSAIARPNPKGALIKVARAYRISEGTARMILCTQGAFVAGLHVSDKVKQVMPVYSMGELADELTGVYLTRSIVSSVMGAPLALCRKLEIFRGLVSDNSVAGEFMADVAENGRLTY